MEDLKIRTIESNYPSIDLKRESNSRNSNANKINEIKKKLDNISISLDYKLEYHIDEKTKIITVKIIDEKTNKVIKEIPPEDILKFLSKFKEMLGVLFDRRT